MYNFYTVYFINKLNRYHILYLLDALFVIVNSVWFFFFPWRSSFIVQQRVMILWGVIKSPAHTHTQIHTHKSLVPLFLSKSHQHASFVFYTSHRMPCHLGTISPPFVSSFFVPVPASLAASVKKTVNFHHRTLCCVSGECCLLLQAWQLPMSSQFPHPV